MRTLSYLGCLLVFVQLAACGGSDSGGDSGSSGDGDGESGGDGDGESGGDGDGHSVCDVQIDLDASLTLGELTQEQADHTCDAYGDLLLCTIPEWLACRNEGLTAARSEGTDSAETCRTVEAECLLEGSKTQQEWEEPCEGSTILTECDVTVAELRQCWTDLFATTAQLLAEREEPSCDDVAEYFEWAEAAESQQYPPSCDAFLACDGVQ